MKHMTMVQKSTLSPILLGLMLLIQSGELLGDTTLSATENYIISGNSDNTIIVPGGSPVTEGLFLFSNQNPLIADPADVNDNSEAYASVKITSDSDGNSTVTSNAGTVTMTSTGGSLTTNSSGATITSSGGSLAATASGLTLTSGAGSVTTSANSVATQSNGDVTIQVDTNETGSGTFTVSDLNGASSTVETISSSADNTTITSTGGVLSTTSTGVAITSSSGSITTNGNSVSTLSNDDVTFQLDSNETGGGTFTISDLNGASDTVQTLTSSADNTTITSTGGSLSATTTGANITSTGGSLTTSSSGVAITSSSGSITTTGNSVGTLSNDDVTIQLDSNETGGGAFTVSDLNGVSATVQTISSSADNTTITSTGGTLSATSSGATITSSGGSLTTTATGVAITSGSGSITTTGNSVGTLSNDDVTIQLDTNETGGGAFTVSDLNGASATVQTISSSADNTTITSSGGTISNTSTGIVIDSNSYTQIKGGTQSGVITLRDGDTTGGGFADGSSITIAGSGGGTAATVFQTTSDATTSTVSTTMGTSDTSKTSTTKQQAGTSFISTSSNSGIVIDGTTSTGNSAVTITGNGNGNYDVELLSHDQSAGIRINNDGVEIFTPQLVNGGQDYNNTFGSGSTNAANTTLSNSIGAGGLGTVDNNIGIGSSGTVNNTIGSGGSTADSRVVNNIGLGGSDASSTVINNIGTQGGGGSTKTYIGNSVNNTLIQMVAGAATTTANNNTVKSELTGGFSMINGATQSTSGLFGVTHQGQTSVIADDSGALTIGTAQQTTAAVVVTNGLGNTHGLVVNEQAVVLSGGTHSSSMTLDDAGARFSNSVNRGPITVTGVADGHSQYDAVNRGQLNRAYSGIASIAAMSQIPPLNSGNRFSFGVGIGYFENEGALAMGIKSTIDRSTNLSISLGHDTQQRTSLAAGLGWNWW
ncbi:MAG: S-layer family protein [Gammaproteobacteria bacterium]|nr:S-layer family protein [Gammaproteobacteria bacterium]